MKGYNETSTTNEKGTVTHEVSQDRAVEVDETSPRLHAEVTIKLGDFQFLKVGSHRSGVDNSTLTTQILEDMVALKNEFKRRHKDLFS